MSTLLRGLENQGLSGKGPLQNCPVMQLNAPSYVAISETEYRTQPNRTWKLQINVRSASL